MPTKIVNKSDKDLTTQVAGATFHFPAGQTVEVGDLRTASEVIQEQHVVAKIMGDIGPKGLEVVKEKAAEPEPEPQPAEPQQPEPQPQTETPAAEPARGDEEGGGGSGKKGKGKK